MKPLATGRKLEIKGVKMEEIRVRTKGEKKERRTVWTESVYNGVLALRRKPQTRI